MPRHDSVFKQIEDHADYNEIVGPILKEAREDRDEIKRLTAQVADLEALVDPPVCRLQFPRGGVPANAKEAAEGWKHEYDRTREIMMNYESRCLKMARVLYGFIHGKRPDGTCIDLQTALNEAKKVLDG
jgi:hypothetical protein